MFQITTAALSAAISSNRTGVCDEVACQRSLTTLVNQIYLKSKGCA